MLRFGIPDYRAEPLVGELLEVLHNVDNLPGGVRILDEAVVGLKVKIRRVGSSLLQTAISYFNAD